MILSLILIFQVGRKGPSHIQSFAPSIYAIFSIAL